METLRIISWNCRVGGFRYKSANVEPLRADILAVQGVEPIDNVLVSGGVEQPTFRNQIKDPANPSMKAVDLQSMAEELEVLMGRS